MSIVCDVYVDLDNNPTVADGTAVTTAHLVNGTQMSGGASGKWTLSGANTKLTIGAHLFPMYDSIQVRGVGTFAPGHTSRSLRLDTTAGTLYAEIDLTSFAKSKVSMGCWVQSNVPYSGSTGALYDIIEIVAGITGNITNFQFCDGTTVGSGSDYCYNSETTGGGSVHWGITNWPRNAATLPPPVTPLWASIYSDIIGGVNGVAIYSPEGRQITLATGTYTGSATDTAGTTHRWGNQEIGAVAGGVIFEHMCVDFTTATFPLIPSEWKGAAYRTGLVTRRRVA